MDSNIVRFSDPFASSGVIVVYLGGKRLRVRYEVTRRGGETMQIHGPAHAHGPQPYNPPHQTNNGRSTAAPNRAHEADQLDISDAAHAISKARDVAPIRHERVAEVRAKIADGTYETAEKLDKAVEQLLNEMA